MFNIGWGELILIVLFALIFVGPERLPRVMRQAGDAIFRLRKIIGEVYDAFGDELRPLQEMQALREELNPLRQIGRTLDAAAPRPAQNTPLPKDGPSIAPPVRPAATNPMQMIGQSLNATGDEARIANTTNDDVTPP